MQATTRATTTLLAPPSGQLLLLEKEHQAAAVAYCTRDRGDRTVLRRGRAIAGAPRLSPTDVMESVLKVATLRSLKKSSRLLAPD